MNPNASSLLGVYPPKGSTQSSAVLAAGIQAITTADDGLLRPRIPIDRCLVVILAFALSAKSTTATFRLWAGKVFANNNKEPSKGAMLQCLGTGTCITSASAAAVAGSGTGLDSNAAYVADQVTFTPSTNATTPKGPQSSRATALGEDAGTVFSPNDSGVTPAELTIAHNGRYGFFIVEWTDSSGVTKWTIVNRAQI